MAMGKFEDLTGKRFGRLVVKEKIKTRNLSGRSVLKWRCKCDCGGEALTLTQYLNSGHTISCGCYNREQTSKAKTKHGLHGTRVYSTWCAMKTRCNNPNADNYNYYGGRGISVCAEWDNFESFYNDMGDCPENHYIERVDNNKNYTADNCIWATMVDQGKNRRCNSNNTSGVKGVYWHSRDERWEAHIGLNNLQIYLGSFDSKDEAIKARKQAEDLYWEDSRKRVEDWVNK